MTKPQGRTMFDRQPLGEKDTSFPFRAQESGILSVENVTGGMVTALPRDLLPKSSFKLVRNGRSREHWLGRRPGTKEYVTPPVVSAGVTVALSGEISAIIMGFKDNSSQAGSLAVSEPGYELYVIGETTPVGGNITAVWKLVAVADPPLWQQVTDSGGLSNPDFLAQFGHRIKSAQYGNLIFFVDGQAGLKYIDMAPLTGGAAEIREAPTDGSHLFDSRANNAPGAQVITTFAERVIVGNLKTEITVPGPSAVGDPSALAWSANGLPLDWNILDATLVPTGAGTELLIQSPSDANDAITGLFGLTNEMVILRERSIWHATRQPFASSPFRFLPIIVGFGCDLMYSAVQGEGGVFYADFRSKGVFFYQPGARPQRISLSIDDELFEDLQNMARVEGAFDAREREYHLGLNLGDTNKITKRWIYSVRTQAWSFDDGLELDTIASFVDFTNLDILPDEPAGDLTGSLPALPPGIIMGSTDQKLLIFDPTEDFDVDGTLFGFEIISQNLGSPSRVRVMNDLLLRYEASQAGSGTLEVSTDGVLWREGKRFDISDSPGERAIGLPMGAIEGRGLYWRLIADSSDIKLTAYTARFTDKSFQHQDAI